MQRFNRCLWYNRPFVLLQELTLFWCIPSMRESEELLLTQMTTVKHLCPSQEHCLLLGLIFMQVWCCVSHRGFFTVESLFDIEQKTEVTQDIPWSLTVFILFLLFFLHMIICALCAVLLFCFLGRYVKWLYGLDGHDLWFTLMPANRSYSRFSRSSSSLLNLIWQCDIYMLLDITHQYTCIIRQCSQPICFTSLYFLAQNPSLSILKKTRQKEGSLLYPNLLKNGLWFWSAA